MTPLHFLFIFVFLCTRCFLINRLREYVPIIICTYYMLLLWQCLNNFSESVFEIFGNYVLRIIKTLKQHGENNHNYPHFPFLHRSFIYRKAFLYMAVNCGKFENITTWSYEKRVKQTFCNFSQLQLSFFCSFRG